MTTVNKHRIGTTHRGIRASVAAAVMGVMVLGAAVAPASAGQLVGPDVAVHYADLDINTVAGAERLYERIQLAAAQVCPQADSRLLTQYMAVMRCRNTVVAHAVSGVRSPQVAAVYAARAPHWARSPV
jgi:UrcA family protein